MRHLFITISALLIAAGLGWGQISVNFLEIPIDWGIVSTYWSEADTVTGITVNVGNPGGGNIWDYNDLDSTNNFSQTIVSAEATPYGTQFPNANLVIEAEDLIQFGLPGPGYMFFNLTTTALQLQGLGVELQGAPTSIVFPNPMLWTELPLDYGDDWNSGFLQQIYFDSLGQEYRLDIAGSFNMTADAYGLLQIPAGDESALRVRNDIQINITLYWLLFGIPIQIYADQANYISYMWIVEYMNISALIMSQEGETNPNFTTASSFSVLADITAGDFTVGMIPVNPPIIIPPTGGSFSYQVSLHNNLPEPGNVDIWNGVYLPSGAFAGPLLFRNMTMAAGMTINRTMTQMVPGGIPPGTYYYIFRIGDFSENEVMAQGGFEFIKMGQDLAHNTAGQWDIWGWEEEPDIAADIPSQFELLPAYPNPFNASNTIPFILNTPGEVNLVIYNSLGQEVYALETAGLQIGTNQIVWNAEGMSSGMYIISLESPEQKQIQRVILLK